MGPLFMNQHSLGTILVLVSAISFGFMPIFARFAYGSGVGVQELLFVRFVLAFLLVGLLLRLTRKNLIPSRNQLLVLLFLGGVGYFTTSNLYFTSLLYVPVSVLALVLYTYPAFVTAGSFALGWERASVRVAASLLFALLGLALVADPVFNVMFVGLALALGAAITYTAYILASTRVLRVLSGEVASFYVMGSAGLSFGIALSVTGRLSIAWNLEAWFWVLMISVISTSLAATTFFQGIKLIGPSRASILSVTEPITSLIAASVFFNELLSIRQWSGGLLVFLASIVAALPKTTSEK